MPARSGTPPAGGAPNRAYAAHRSRRSPSKRSFFIECYDCRLPKKQSANGSRHRQMPARSSVSHVLESFAVLASRKPRTFVGAQPLEAYRFTDYYEVLEISPNAN